MEATATLSHGVSPQDDTIDDPCLAFVLSGGGARGALQVGALRALWEAGLRADLWVGTSIGAVNAAYVAVHGFTAEGLAGLEAAWHEATQADLLPANCLWLTIGALFGRFDARPERRMREFFLAHGLEPELRFEQLKGARLILVAADLRTGSVILYGTEPEQSVLEGLMASTAMPPWVWPMAKDGRLLVDGGVASILPIEPALAQGATEIVALDLSHLRPAGLAPRAASLFLNRLMKTVERRQIDLELALARAHGVSVRRIALRAESPVPIWDFTRSDELMAQGYEIARQQLGLVQPCDGSDVRWDSEGIPLHQASANSICGENR